MIPRVARKALDTLAKGFPVLALTGPRQSGKTTLARSLFADKPYVSLENPDAREYARQDPRRFLAQFEANGAVIDEIQREPALLSWLQGLVDERARMGDFVITGSAQFELLAGISQSLAGRVGRVELLPLAWGEIVRHRPSLAQEQSLDALMWQGGYPALYNEERTLSPSLWHANYAATYVERDARALIQVRDLGQFQRFIKLCAMRSGQVLNASALGADAGVSAQTTRHWLSVLEASYLVTTIAPYFNNFGKRITKAPKLYFLDTGLLCYLMGIQDAVSLSTHAARGAIFETWVMSERIKLAYNQGQPHALNYWRTVAEKEIDVVHESHQGLGLMEIKSGSTVASDWFKALNNFPAPSDAIGQRTLLYGGDESYERQGVQVQSWRGLGV
jgi:uncharacterized protein